jgi:hypothetical protein
MVKKAALTADSMVFGAAAHSASVAAQEKVTEKELKGEISEDAASSLRAALRVAEVGSSVTVSAVTGQASKQLAPGGSAGMGDALRQAVHQPGATVQTFIDGHNLGATFNADTPMLTWS